MNGKLALLLVLVLLALPAGAVAAQAPDDADATYTLTWWTVDGGGVSYTTSGSYTLGGTAGQPDAAIEQTGGTAPVYTLRAGFWQRSCTAAAATPRIALLGSTITVSWDDVPGSEGRQQVYRVLKGATPYFTPAQALSETWVSAAPWQFSETDDPAANTYYLLRATCGAAYADGQRKGEFDFTLVRGG